MLLDTIIEPLSDLSTVAAQSVVEWIADHSSITRDGWAMTGVRLVVAAMVFLTIAVGVPLVIIGVLWWLALTLLF
jgi:hypothetical protein